MQYQHFRSLRQVEANHPSYKKSTVARWLHDAQNKAEWFNNIRTRSRHKIIPILIKFTKECIKKNPFFTKEDIKTMYFMTTGIHVSISTVGVVLKKMLNITKKRSRRSIVKNKQYFEQLKNQRDVFLEEVKLIDKNTIISLDEYAVTKEMLPSYGYSYSGTRVYAPVKVLKTNKVSVLMAISNKCEVGTLMYEGSINTEIFCKFLKDTLLPALSTKPYVFLMDNVRFHHSKQAVSLITEAGHRILYTPPYSPDCNPIENVISIIKSKIKRESKNNIEELKRVTSNSILLVPERAFRNCFDRLSHFDYTFLHKTLNDRMAFMGLSIQETMEILTKLKS